MEDERSMARLTGPKHRICRRVGEPVCGSPKCPALKRPYPPGQHGKMPRRRVSEFGRQLLEKQKIKAIYGVSETYLRNTLDRESSRLNSSHVAIWYAVFCLK